MRRAGIILLIIAAGILPGPRAAQALEPAEIAVIYNADFDGSKALAEYYAGKRGVPTENLVAIRASREDKINHATYEKTIEAPVKAWLDEGGRKKKIQCLLTIRGVPISTDEPEDPAKYHARDLAKDAADKAEAEKKRIEEELKAHPTEALREKLAEIDRQLPGLKEAAKRAFEVWRESVAGVAVAVDSELAVMYWPNHPLKGWMPNALYWKTWTAPDRAQLPKTFMTSRLDGPTDAVVRRIVDDSIATEAVGLKGVAYFDAWHKYKGQTPYGDAICDMDEMVRRAGREAQAAGMKTVVDDTDQVFQPGTCPNAAIYCGWYSIGHYVPAFTWVRGAVGYHIASAEGMALRDPKATYWCKRMIEEGAAATFGPIAEPYVNTFPSPPEFFAFLFTGRYTMAEVFWYTSPVDSWMMVLVADPLYTPFKKNPLLTVTQMREVIAMPAN